MPINVVKEMLGRYSVKQTEEYAITEQASISREMKELGARLKGTDNFNKDLGKFLQQLEKEFKEFKESQKNNSNVSFADRLNNFENIIDRAKELIQ